MDAKAILEYQWPYLLSFFPAHPELEASAYQTGALRRRRAVDSASPLLRLALAYGFCGLSLRQTAAWAETIGFASLSDVALLKRLRGAADWMGFLLASKLAERAGTPPAAAPCSRVRLVDATVVSRPGSTGTDWRVHLGYNLSALAIDSVELTDFRGGETLTRFRFQPGELVLGDRGYAHRAGLHAVRHAGADFIVRMGWQNLPLADSQNGRFDLFAALRSLPEAEPGSFVVMLPGQSAATPALPLRLVALRKSEAAAQQAREKLLRDRRKKGGLPDPRSLEAAGYIFLLTSVPATRLGDNQVLDWYRFRWQIEMAFKRLKGLLQLGLLPAKDTQLARTIIYSKLLAALLLDDFTERFLSFSPWGYRLR